MIESKEFQIECSRRLRESLALHAEARKKVITADAEQKCCNVDIEMLNRCIDLMKYEEWLKNNPQSESAEENPS